MTDPDQSQHGESSPRKKSIEIPGDLTSREALDVLDELAHLPLRKVDIVELSFEQVSSIDENGLAALIRVYSNLKWHRKALVLTHVGPTVRQTLLAIGLGGLLEDGGRPGRFISASFRAVD